MKKEKRIGQLMVVIALALCAVIVNVKVEAQTEHGFIREQIKAVELSNAPVVEGVIVTSEPTPELTPEPEYVSSLQAVNVFPEPTPEPEPEPVPEPAAEPTYTTNTDGWTYYGNCRITFYCSGACCCGAYASGYTASGTAVTPNRTVACGSDIPFGTELLIDGQIYVCEDRGVGSGQVDIYVPTHEEALRRGLYYTDVYVR